MPEKNINKNPQSLELQQRHLRQGWASVAKKVRLLIKFLIINCYYQLIIKPLIRITISSNVTSFKV